MRVSPHILTLVTLFICNLLPNVVAGQADNRTRSLSSPSDYTFENLQAAFDLQSADSATQQRLCVSVSYSRFVGVGAVQTLNDEARKSLAELYVIKRVPHKSISQGQTLSFSDVQKVWQDVIPTVSLDELRQVAHLCLQMGTGQNNISPGDALFVGIRILDPDASKTNLIALNGDDNVRPRALIVPGNADVVLPPDLPDLSAAFGEAISYPSLVHIKCVKVSYQRLVSAGDQPDFKVGPNKSDPKKQYTPEDNRASFRITRKRTAPQQNKLINDKERIEEAQERLKGDQGRLRKMPSEVALQTQIKADQEQLAAYSKKEHDDATHLKVDLEKLQNDSKKLYEDKRNGLAKQVVLDNAQIVQDQEQLSKHQDPQKIETLQLVVEGAYIDAATKTAYVFVDQRQTKEQDYNKASLLPGDQLYISVIGKSGKVYTNGDGFSPVAITYPQRAFGQYDIDASQAIEQDKKTNVISNQWHIAFAQQDQSWFALPVKSGFNSFYNVDTLFSQDPRDTATLCVRIE